MKSYSLLVLTILVAAFLITAADWPQWRGPGRNGISRETGLLQEWPKDGPTKLWQVKDVGSGYSTPAVVGDHLFLLANEGMENEFVQARLTKDGSQVWKTRIGKVGFPDQNPPYPGARSTPTVDGDLVFALGSDGDLVCLEKGSGQLRWHHNVQKEFGGQHGKWAYAESPLVDGDKVVCTPGGAKAAIVALNKNSGDVVWTATIPGGDEAGYASIITVNVGGKKQYVQFLGKGVVGVDASNGKFLWRYDRTGSGPANIPTPLADESFIYSAGGKVGAALLQLNVSPESVEAVEKYYSLKLPSSIGGAVKVGNYLYGTIGRETSGTLMCVEFATGEVKWQERGVGAGSICFADGRLYIHGEGGDVALVEPSPEGYREKGRFTPSEQPDRGMSQAWAYPAVANGRLYLRDMGTIWCYDIKRAN